MRLIDADELKKVIETYRPRKAFNDYSAGKNNMVNYCLDEIENAPTVDITEEQAIDKLHETGWLPRHDKEMTERPIGKWAVTKSILSDETLVECSLCGDSFLGRDTEDYNYCPICGAKMMKGEEE